MRKSLQSFKRVIAEYGVVALVIHYIIFGVVITAAYLAMRAGWQPSSRIAGVGTWAAAYVVAKLTQPVRLIATVALTPIVARSYERITGRAIPNLFATRETPESGGSSSVVASPPAASSPVGPPSRSPRPDGL
ncbi:MAG: FAM210 family protein [Gemmatimonadaceae bacterium]